MLPAGATLVRNPNGTAPAFIVEDRRGTVISLPGVPFEMKWLVQHEVVPYLRRRWGLERVIHHRVLKVGELGESAVDHRIGAIMRESVNPKVGVLARPGQVDVRISARADSPAAARALIAPTEARVRAALGDHVFAADAETLESVVAAALARHGWRVACCEDRTGGGVAAALREAAGVRFVEGRVVATATGRARLAQAGGEGAEASGAALAAALARAVLRLSDADLAVAVHAADPEAAADAAADAAATATEGAGARMAGAATMAGSAQPQNLGPGNTWLAVIGATGEYRHHLGIGARGQVDRRRVAVAALSLLRRALL